MSNIDEQIISIRSAVGASYSKPSKELFEEQIKALSVSDIAMSYLRNERGLSDETIYEFKLGYDLKRNAISIPIFKQGELINIKYRNLKPEEHNNIKYISTRGCENWMFNDKGLSIAKEKGRVLVVEGEFDCMMATQRGLKNVVSPSLGAMSYGVWLELLDVIPEVYIAYDNDKAGIEASKKMADKLGIEKCKEIKYPEGIKDATEYFKKYSTDDFKNLLRSATPFYNYEFVNVSSLLDSLRNEKEQTVSIDYVPNVQFGKDWLAIISGITNVGKTAYCMNLADELSKKDVPVLIFPFERGIESVGKRYLQVHHNMSEADFIEVPSDEWTKMQEDAVSTQVYFSLPKREKLIDTIKRAKRIFNIGAVVIDHLDYMIRRTANKNDEIGKTLQELKELAIEQKVIIFVVHHLNKLGNTDEAFGSSNRKPVLEDLKGSSNLYQDPECVIMLYSEHPDTITVDIQKNKGKMSSKKFNFIKDTGKILLDTKDLKTDTSKLSLGQQQKLAEEIFF